MCCNQLCSQKLRRGQLRCSWTLHNISMNITYNTKMPLIYEHFSTYYFLQESIICRKIWKSIICRKIEVWHDSFEEHYNNIIKSWSFHKQNVLSNWSNRNLPLSTAFQVFDHSAYKRMEMHPMTTCNILEKLVTSCSSKHDILGWSFYLTASVYQIWSIYI